MRPTPANATPASGPGHVLRALAASLGPPPASRTRTLIFAAVPAEALAIASGALRRPVSSLPFPPPDAAWRALEIMPGVDLCVTGVSKSNAAAAASITLDPQRHALALCAGIAGALPDSALAIADVVVATRVPFADEGAQEPDRFVPCHAMGFPLGPFPHDSPATDPRSTDAICAALAPLSPHRGPIACVSTCSATDALAQAIRARTHALAEAMEGAAIAAVCARLRIPFAEIRTISNHTGDRSAQGWNIRAALDRLTDVFGLL